MVCSNATSICIIDEMGQIMKHLFIINPAAGKYDHTYQLKEEIVPLMQKYGLDYELAVTREPRHAVEIVKQAAAGGEALRVYACGGDGTLNEVVNGAAGLSNVSVTQYPIGSGNDFIKIFGPGKEQFFELENLLHPETSAVDLIECNGRYSINICSMGFDARIGTQVGRYKRLPFINGTGAYALSAFSNFIKGIHKHYKITIDDQIFDGRFSLICICNGQWYGGMFNPVPEALPDDGLLDILLVKAVSRLTVASIIGKYAKGRYRDYPDLISHFQSRTVTVQCDKPGPINCDGELLLSDRAVFSLSNQKVNFFYPQGLTWTNEIGLSRNKAAHY